MLKLLESKHPIIGLIGRYRELTKLDNTYLSALPELVAEDGRLHTTFNQTVAPILQAWCYSCHSGSSPSGTIRLDSYSTVKLKVDDGKLLGSIRHDSGYLPMPDGGGKLPNCEISQIEKWVADGALNN